MARSRRRRGNPGAAGLLRYARNDELRLTSNLRRRDDRLEIGQTRIVIMRSRGIEQDQVKPAVDHRADDAALAPQFVAVEMLVIELEAVGAEERPRLQAQGA